MKIESLEKENATLRSTICAMRMLCSNVADKISQLDGYSEMPELALLVHTTKSQVRQLSRQPFQEGSPRPAVPDVLSSCRAATPPVDTQTRIKVDALAAWGLEWTEERIEHEYKL